MTPTSWNIKYFCGTCIVANLAGEMEFENAAQIPNEISVEN